MCSFGDRIDKGLRSDFVALPVTGNRWNRGSSTVRSANVQLAGEQCPQTSNLILPIDLFSFALRR
jgi:hypothetical protein